MVSKNRHSPVMFLSSSLINLLIKSVWEYNIVVMENEERNRQKLVNQIEKLFSLYSLIGMEYSMIITKIAEELSVDKEFVVNVISV